LKSSTFDVLALDALLLFMLGTWFLFVASMRFRFRSLS
jgi:hypothetical protein